MFWIFLKFMLWLLRHAVSLVLLSIPFILKALVLVALLIGISIGSLWLGVTKTVKKIADEWVAKAFYAGVPPAWEKLVYTSAFVLAFLTIITGWLVVAFTTAFIVRFYF
jgi:hypothetical protein